jgi:hypothetical protein
MIEIRKFCNFKMEGKDLFVGPRVLLGIKKDPEKGLLYLVA